MDRKRKTGHVVSYLLLPLTRTLLTSFLAPIIVWISVCGYPDEDASALGTQSGDGVFGILTAFANVVVFVTHIGGITFDCGTMLDSPLSRLDRDGLIVGAVLESTSTEILTLLSVGEENNDTDVNNETQVHE
ncbi:hypothetical protein ACM16X_01435 [Haloarcula japonica]|uniref:hypothetical protein n=1 Tax=Haloarcula japonica TaxID=29282 RepID=UPI0039F73D19